MKLSNIHKQLIRSGLENESTLVGRQLRDLADMLEYTTVDSLLKFNTAHFLATAGALEKLVKQVDAVRDEV
jgi:hypothetical protein